MDGVAVPQLDTNRIAAKAMPNPKRRMATDDLEEASKRLRLNNSLRTAVDSHYGALIGEIKKALDTVP